MNHKFTKYGLFGTILVFLIIFGCRQDDFYNTPTKGFNEQGLKINHITGKEAKRVADRFKNDISAGFLANSGTGMTSKTTGGTGTIKYDEIIEVIDTLGNTNYTFLIEGHPEQDKNSIFNLIVNVKNGEQNILLVKHQMEENFANSYHSGVVPLENFTGNLVVQYIGNENPCIEEVITYPIDNGTGTGIGGGGSGGGGSGGGSGGSGSGGGSGGGSGSGGSGSTNNNPPALLEDLNADPCPDVICDSEDQVKEDCQCITYVSINPRYFKIGYDLVVENMFMYDPCDDNSGTGNIGTIGVIKFPERSHCESLKELFDPQKHNLKHYINDIAAKYQQGMPDEISYSFKRETEYDGSTTYSATYETGTATSVKISMGDYYAAIHLHPKNSGVPGGIFSWLDIRTLRDLYNEAPPYRQEDNDVSLMVLAPDPSNNSNYNVYAITVTDIELLSSHVDTDWNYPDLPPGTDVSTDEKKLLAIQDKLARDYINGYNNSTDLEKTFLQQFGHYGLSLYKLNSNDEWDELRLHIINQEQKITKPCN